MSSRTIAIIADIASFILMRWVLGWGFIVSFVLSIGVFYLTIFALKQMGRAD